MTDQLPCDRDLAELWQRLHEKRHDIEAESLRIAREEINRRLNEMNEFRAQLSQERTVYVTRDWHDRERDQIRDAVSVLGIDVDRRLKILENASSNWQGRWWAVGAIVALALAVGGLLSRLLIR